MNNSLYVGLSRQMTLQREMDVVANNIANSDTAGFKVESVRLETDTQTPKVTGGGPRPSAINFVQDAGVQRDFGQGPLRTTGAPLDMALQGDGFFSVQTANGLRYTRDGRFSLDGGGQVVDTNGDPVQRDGGGAIIVDPLKSAPAIAKDGTITQTDPLTGITTVTGKIGVANFATPQALQKDGAGMYENVSNLAPLPVRTTTVMQGMIESSNVNSIAQMTHLIAVSRAYESVANMMSQTGDTSDQSIQRLGKVN
jgi:flagellar basal-body rod protein FlgF